MKTAAPGRREGWMQWYRRGQRRELGGDDGREEGQRPRGEGSWILGLGEGGAYIYGRVGGR
jgi:hypothetical protein